MKHICFCIYLVMFPLRGKWPLAYFFFLANFFSLLNRKLCMRAKDSFMHMILADEEAMHLIWFLTYILLGWQLKIFVDLMFLSWALLNTVEWLDYLITKHPGIPIIGLFANLIQMTQDNAIGIVTVKNYVEVLIVPVSLVMWMVSWCAPVLGIMLVQYVRIKFMGSAYTKLALIGVDGWI